MSDLQQEHQRETEGLLDNIRELSKELRLQSMVIDSYIPQEFQVNLESAVKSMIHGCSTLRFVAAICHANSMGEDEILKQREALRL